MWLGKSPLSVGTGSPNWGGWPSGGVDWGQRRGRGGGGSEERQEVSSVSVARGTACGGCAEHALPATERRSSERALPGLAAPRRDPGGLSKLPPARSPLHAAGCAEGALREPRLRHRGAGALPRDGARRPRASCRPPTSRALGPGPRAARAPSPAPHPAAGDSSPGRAGAFTFVFGKAAPDPGCGGPETADASGHRQPRER